MEPIYAGVIAFARGVFKIEGLRFTIEGVENLPKTGGAVLASNHLSYLDFAYIGLAPRQIGRKVRFMAKEEVFRHRISGPLMRGMKHIPVDRAAGAGSFRAAVTALKAGELVGVFPEATISRSLEPKEFKPGAARMAAAAGVPIVPIAIWGSQRVWTKGQPKRLGRTNIEISISVGAPIGVAKRSDFDVVTATVATDITTMLHKAQQSYPTLADHELAFLPARLGGTAPTPDEAARLDEAEAQARAARSD